MCAGQSERQHGTCSHLTTSLVASARRVWDERGRDCVVEGLEDECIGKEGDAGISPDMRQKWGGGGGCERGNGGRSVGKDKS